MKTLDEVIEELNIWDTCDEFPESFYDFEVTRDALHYLKAYKEMVDGIVNIIVQYKETFKMIIEDCENGNA